MTILQTIGLLILLSTSMVASADTFGKQIASANNKFAFDLYNIIKDEEKDNICISPLNIASCMGMLYMMTRGQTTNQISEAMHFPANQVNTAVGFQQCLKQLDGEGFSWANSIFLGKSFDVKQSFMEELNRYWNATAKKLDFAKEPKKSRDYINNWVASRTNQMIKDLLPESFPQPNTEMVLVSALHFKRPWYIPFQADGNKGLFHLANGKTVQVDTMHAESSRFSLKRLSDINADVLKIPYKDEKQSMVIFLPSKSDGLPGLEAHLSKLDLENDILKKMHAGYMIRVTMTKFKFEDSRKLETAFQKLGMKSMFNAREADFTRGSDSRNLELTNVYHKTMIIVDEKGTEASAATGGEIALASMPRSIVVDKPFLFAIIDESSKTIAFLGRYTKPDH